MWGNVGRSALLLSFCENRFCLSQLIKMLNSTERGALFRHFCVSKVITTAHAHKSGVIFHFLPRAFKQKQNKALRPKMTKIASRGFPFFIRMRRSFNFQSIWSLQSRARKTVSRGGELLTALSKAGSGQIISVQNGEHSFCSKRCHDEEKSFNGHSFLPAKRGASSAEPPFFCSHGIRGRNQWKEPCFDSKIDQHRRRSTSTGRCCAAADRLPAADIVLELRSSYS